MKLTDKIIETVALPVGVTDKVFFDNEVTNLGVRVRASGQRSWLLQYSFHGRARRLTLGNVNLLTCAKARSAAKDLLAKVRLGTDPASEKATARAEARARAAETFALVPRYLEFKKAQVLAGKLKSRSYEEIERHMQKHAAPLHSRSVRIIDLRAAADFLDKIIKPTVRNRVRSSLGAMWEWMLREALVVSNPFAYTNKAEEKGPRERTPAIDELVEIWKAAGEYGQYGQIVRLLMLTGCRRSEIACIGWSEVFNDRVNLDGARIKNSEPHTIPLTPAMRAIFNELPERHDEDGDRRDLIFGVGEGGFSDFSGSKADLDARIQTNRKGSGRKPMGPWVPHDFRRSMSTTMHDELDIPPHIVEACLNHIEHNKGGVAGVYNNATYFKAKQDAFTAWNSYLMRAVRGGKIKQSAKVVPFRRETS
jgi:integrase